MAKPQRLYLIDGSGYIFRAFHALPPMTRADGTPVNAVYGFCSMLSKLLDELRADDGVEELVAVIFDTKRDTFRKAIFDAYKANRPPPPDDLIPQFALIRDATRAFNVHCLELEGYEADDLIATYAKQAFEKGVETVVISADKDLMQLIRPGVSMRDPIKNKPIGPAEVQEKFGVTPDKVIDVQALAGDSTDNVPGVRGIGVKTAAELINTYGDLETLLKRTAEIKQPKRREALETNAELARISKQLVTLKDDVPVPQMLADLTWQEPDPQRLLDFVTAQGFRSLATRLGGTVTASATTGGAAPTAKAAEPEKIPTDAGVYETVTTIADLGKWVDAARACGVVGVALGMTGADPWQARLVGIGLSVAPGKGCYVPLRHVSQSAQGSLLEAGDDAPPQAPYNEAIELLRPLFSDTSVLKIGHDIKRAMHGLAAGGIENVASIDDVEILSYVLDGAKNKHDLDTLAEQHFGFQTTTLENVCGKGKDKIGFERCALDKATGLVAQNADFALRLHRTLRPRLVHERVTNIYDGLERQMIPVLRDMEAAGIVVDPRVLKTMSADFGKRMAELETQIHKLAGTEFNIGSPKQLGEILFDRMSLPGGKKGKTGAYGTGADVLEELVGQGHDLPARVLDWRQISKLKSTYTDALQEEINPNTGRVHTTFDMAVASTGRLSSTDPNLQNIPIRTEEGRKIRTAFVAPKGKVLLSADYSQIELRLVAHVADIKAMKKAFNENADIHAATASEMFNVPVAGMDPSIRRRAKAINFGIIYGISGFGLANQLGIERGEAQDYIKRYFERFPEIRTYMDRTKEEAKKHGFVWTPFGRKVWIPYIADKNPAMRSFGERAAINAPIQGGAADIIKKAMIRLPKILRDKKLSATMLLQVHDELIFEVPSTEVEETKSVVKKVMESVVQIDVPIVVDAGVGDSWAQAH